jgi:hypothetical protein
VMEPRRRPIKRGSAGPSLVCDGTNVGSIERVMIDKVSGKVAYAVLCFGGFMGVGVKHIPVPWDRMKYGERRRVVPRS